jgi:hypothetical protein
MVIDWRPPTDSSMSRVDLTPCFLVMMGLALLTGCGKPISPTALHEKEAGEKHTQNEAVRTLAGRWEWNTRYGIVVQMAPGRIQNAKVVEYSEEGKIVDVGQTAITTDETISIVFDEYAGEAIGIANYKVSTTPIIRDGIVYVSVSGREVKMQGGARADAEGPR